MGPLHLFCALPCSLRIALPPLRLAPVLPLRRPSLPPVTPPSLLLPQGGLWNYSWRTGLDASGQPVHNSSEAAPAALPLPWAQQLVPSNSARRGSSLPGRLDATSAQSVVNSPTNQQRSRGVSAFPPLPHCCHTVPPPASQCTVTCGQTVPRSASVRPIRIETRLALAWRLLKPPLASPRICRLLVRGALWAPDSVVPSARGAQQYDAAQRTSPFRTPHLQSWRPCGASVH